MCVCVCVCFPNKKSRDVSFVRDAMSPLSLCLPHPSPVPSPPVPLSLPVPPLIRFPILHSCHGQTPELIITGWCTRRTRGGGGGRGNKATGNKRVCVCVCVPSPSLLLSSSPSSSHQHHPEEVPPHLLPFHRLLCWLLCLFLPSEIGWGGGKKRRRKGGFGGASLRSQPPSFPPPLPLLLHPFQGPSHTHSLVYYHPTAHMWEPLLSSYNK